MIGQGAWRLHQLQHVSLLRSFNGIESDAFLMFYTYCTTQTANAKPISFLPLQNYLLGSASRVSLRASAKSLQNLHRRFDLSGQLCQGATSSLSLCTVILIRPPIFILHSPVQPKMLPPCYISKSSNVFTFMSYHFSFFLNGFLSMTFIAQRANVTL